MWFKKRLSNLNVVEGRHSGQSLKELMWIITSMEQPCGKKFTDMKKTPHPCEKWACGGQELGRARGGGGQDVVVMVKATEEFSFFAFSSPSSFSSRRGSVWNFISVVKRNFPFVVSSVLANLSDRLRNVLLLQSQCRFVGTRSPYL